MVLVPDDPRSVLPVIELSRAAYRKMWQNLAWATGYNVITVPVAVGVPAFAGVSVSPAVAAIADERVHRRGRGQRSTATAA